MTNFLLCLNCFTENLPDGVHFCEEIAIKTWVNALSLSDTVPGDVISAFATTYMPAVVKVPCTLMDPCWERKL